jgi:hypothetical protein
MSWGDPLLRGMTHSAFMRLVRAPSTVFVCLPVVLTVALLAPNAQALSIGGFRIF